MKVIEDAERDSVNLQEHAQTRASVISEVQNNTSKVLDAIGEVKAMVAGSSGAVAEKAQSADDPKPAEEETLTHAAKPTEDDMLTHAAKPTEMLTDEGKPKEMLTDEGKPKEMLTDEKAPPGTLADDETVAFLVTFWQQHGKTGEQIAAILAD
eukprot:10617705-Karenia_brevis.AAC.1